MAAYVVKEGDNLSKIGQELFGDAEFWRGEEFRAANPDLDVNKLSIGQRIEIPGFEAPEVEGMPEPRTNPRREYTAGGGRGFGPPPVTEPDEDEGSGFMPLDHFLANLANMGGSSEEVEEQAIPEELTFADTAAAMEKRFGHIPSPHRTGNVQVTPPASAQPVNPVEDTSGLLKRGVTRPTEEAGPDFSMASNPARGLPANAGAGTDIGVNFANADPGEELVLTPEQMARFQPEQADKVNEVLRIFFREPNLIDEVLQSIGVTSPAAAEQ